MPISDEVIELAPVKKTKKTLIILISVMGALFALAVAFLVMYLIKPSVTEDKNHVKDITLVATDLFSETENGEVKYYASIGNEYTLYSTLTVDNNSSTNVQWDFGDSTLLEIKEQKNDGEPYVKFIPRVGMHGKTAKITVRAPSQVSEYKTITFTIVNQGAEDIQVNKYGVRGSVNNDVKDDTITVSYYSSTPGSQNNSSIFVTFEQLSKYDPTSKEYAKLTSIKTETNGPSTDDVTVTSGDESVISIEEDNVSNKGFSFRVNKNTNSAVPITIKANVYNDHAEEVTKTILVKVESNVALGYVDSMYVFNKPIVDAELIGKVEKNGDTSVIDSQKLKTEIGKDKTVKTWVSNDDQIIKSKDFVLELPYSYNNSVTYNDIFKHLLLNPLKIQYDGKEITNTWYKDIEVKSSDSKMLQVTTLTDGSVKLYPNNVGECKLTFTDKKKGSASAKIEVPVRIVAQTDNVELVCDTYKAALKKDPNNPNITHDVEFPASANTEKPYEVSLTYTFVAQEETPKTLATGGCLNNKFKLDFDETEMDVTLKGSTAKLKPNEEKTADFGDTITKVTGTSGSNTQYKATITFCVTVKMNSTGAAKLTFIKNGSELYGDEEDNNSLKSKDRAVELSASFKITESATKAFFKKDEEGSNTNYLAALNLVTENGKYAGNFVRNEDRVASIYVQNRPAGTLLYMQNPTADSPSILSPESIASLVEADKTYFKVDSINPNNAVTGVTWTDRDKKLTFSGSNVTSGSQVVTITFNVLNVGNSNIGSFTLLIYIIDAVTELRTVESKQVQNPYGATTNVSVSLAANEITVVRVVDKQPKNYTCTDANLYYDGGMFDKDSDDNGNYTYKHGNKALYRYETGPRTLSTLTDIYAYSYENGINFGEVYLECLLDEKVDEYVGKHFGESFEYKYKTKFIFERKADGAALFTDDKYQNDNEVTPHVTDGFNVSVNQDTDAFLYATSIVNVTLSTGPEKIYVEKAENGHKAPVQKATFTVPTGITPVTKDETTSGGRYYSITYHAPAITGERAEYDKGANVNYADTYVALKFTVNNVTRKISSIGIYSDEACTSGNSIDGETILFGGFINEANKYSKTVYVKVEYENNQPSFANFEPAELSLPSYLKVDEKIPLKGTNTYILIPGKWTTDNNYYEVYTCKLVLDKNEQVTDSKIVEIVPSNHKTSGPSATLTVNVQAGLKTLTVKNGENTVATVTAGNIGTYSDTFDLKNPADIKSLELTFVYEATNSEGYGLAYNHTGLGLKYTAPTAANGFAFTNNIKAETSKFTVATAGGIETGTQTFTLTFTDEYNGANTDNVFTLKITITVTMDIYALAFADDASTAVTVYQGTGDAQTLNISVVYNNNNDKTQPDADIIKDNKVLGVYVLNGTEYETFDGITVTPDASGKTYTVQIPNNIDRSQTYYLRLVYDKDKVTYSDQAHCRRIVINTLSSHIEFDKNNTIKPTQAEPYEASFVVQSASDEFTLVVNVVNDGSGEPESGKTVTYGLYTDLGCTSSANGITIDNGVIRVTDPAAINGNKVYYLAEYVDAYTSNPYSFKVKLTYTVAPSAVAISGVDANAFNSADKKLTLYYGNADNYTQADLRGKIVAGTVFGKSYADENVVYSVALQNATDSAYLDVRGFILNPKALNGNTVTNVPVVVTAKYAGVEVDEVYNVVITPITTLTLTQSSGTLDILDRTSALTVEPTITPYRGFTPVYTLTATQNGVFNITGDGNSKTVKLASGSGAKKGTYTLNARLSYTYSAVADGGITAVGTFVSNAIYTVKVEGDYALTFDLMYGTDVISVYENTESTKYSVIDDDATYSIKVTSDDADFDVMYKATVTNAVVSVGTSFINKKVTVTPIKDASGAFAITVTATVGGETYTKKQNYYFMYGANIVAKLYMSSNNGNTYDEFNNTSQKIDHAETASPYKFKYEITGVPEGATVNLVVNGDVNTAAMQTDGNTRYWIITTANPTTMRIGASVKIGSRTVYLEEKQVRLTATPPSFTFVPAATVLPSGTVSLSIANSASDFRGGYDVSYSVESGSKYAKISGSTLTAEKNVVTDQTVIVRATITVNNGVYADTYTIDKAVTVKGVALPSITFKDSAERDVVIGNNVYSENDYTFDGTVEGYAYSGIILVMSASSDSLTSADYELNGTTLTVKDTNKTRAGGSMQLTITATITSGPHNGESVSDTITVRVLPTMNTMSSNIMLGNAKAIYDLNGTAFKSTFAPNTNIGTGFVNSADKYSIISLTLDSTVDENKFGVDGSKLIIMNNLEAATTIDVTATVLITGGAYAGTTVVGTKTVTIEVPTASLSETVAWNGIDYKYNDIALSKSNVLDDNIEGTVGGITVVVPDGVAEYVTVKNNGTSTPVVSVHKNYGAYFTDPAPERKFTLKYVVALEDGKVYYSTAQYTVVAQKVNITANVGDELVGSSGLTVNVNETFIMQLSADNGFDVVITAVSNSALYNMTFGGNGVQFNVGSVNTDQDVNVTLTLNVAGQTATHTFVLAVLAPQTNAQYTATNTDNADFAKDDGNFAVGVNQNNAVASTWTAADNAQFKYAQKLTITAPNGHNLNEYFDSLNLEFNGQQYSATSINGNSATINFPTIVNGWGMTVRQEVGSFKLNMEFKTSTEIPLSTIDVKLTVYNRDRNGSATDVTVLYRIQVTGAIAVTLNTNAGDDTEEVDYDNPLYKHSYNLPTPTRTGYTFVGWYTAEKGGSKVESNATVTNTQPHTLYARWTAKIYNVQYNANYTDAPAISATKTVTYGQTYGELNTPTRTGYDFVGWAVGSAANSQIITANTLVNPADSNVSTITLYAQWRIRYYTVTLDENYTGGPEFTFQVAYGQSFNIHNLFRPTREGYRFDGWNIVEGDVTNVTSDVTLTARWIQLYTVSFNANAEGDVTNPQSVQMANGDTYVLPTLTRDGYDFGGWYNGETEVVNGTEATLTADIELTAHWTPNVFTVTLNAGEGTIGDSNTYVTNVNKNQSYDLHRIIVPTRAGYSFAGWYNSEDEEQTAAITVTANVMLTAHWTPNTYTVTFDADGGTLAEGEDTITVTYGQVYGELPTPTFSGKSFDSWYTEDGIRIQSTDTVNIIGNQTLVAQWTDESV